MFSPRHIADDVRRAMSSRTMLRWRSGDTVLILIAAVIGIVTGGVILLFNATVEFAGRNFDDLFALSRTMRMSDYLLFPLVPAVGGLLVGMVNVWLFRRPGSHGVPDVIRVSRFARGRIEGLAGLQTLLTASLSIGSGGGGGREGPIVHVGAAVAAVIARIFRLGREHTRTLLTCGAAAGISGIFNAPMGGVMFALEVILGDFRLRTFTPVMVASVTATAITRTLHGDVPLVHSPALFTVTLPEYLLFAVLGLLAGAVSVWFIHSIGYVEKLCGMFSRMHPVLRPAAGGLLAGVLITMLPALMEQSYKPVNIALGAGYPVWMLLVMLALKPVHTALTTGSGGTGGAFAPALKSGAMLGAAFGLGVMALFPSVIHSPSAYAFAGMGAVLAGTMQAPLTGILMLVEISNNYSIILPGMLTAILASVIAQRIARHSVYTRTLELDGVRIGSFAYLPLLSSLAIDPVVMRDAPQTLSTTPLRSVLRLFEEHTHEAVLVVDEQHAYRGLILFEDVRTILTDTSIIGTLVAADVMTSDISHVHASTTMDVVLRLFDTHGWSVLPVLDEDDVTAVGLIAVSDAHTFYRRSVAREQ